MIPRSGIGSIEPKPCTKRLEIWVKNSKFFSTPGNSVVTISHLDGAFRRMLELKASSKNKQENLKTKNKNKIPKDMGHILKKFISVHARAEMS